MNKKFDILDYLNDIYMAKVAPSIDVTKAGGYNNIHSNENNAQEEIQENNKKRIDIPNAKIRYFQIELEQDVEEHNESGTDKSSSEETRQGGTGYNQVSDETTAQETDVGDIIKISDGNNPIQTIVQSTKKVADDLII